MLFASFYQSEAADVLLMRQKVLDMLKSLRSAGSELHTRNTSPCAALSRFHPVPAG